MRSSLIALAAVALSALGTVSVHAQDPVPTEQPSMLTIYMEDVKLGHEAAHEANERGWPAAFAKAGAPETYLALESMTGPSMVWFVEPHADNASQGRTMARNEADPVLSAELSRLWKEDAQHLESARTVQAVGRADLSAGGFPDIARDRFWDISVFRIRIGHEQDFEAAARVYAEKATAQSSETGYRVYQVLSGMPGGTYLFFGSVDDYADFDEVMATDQAVWESMSEDEMEMFGEVGRAAFQSVISYRFRLSPTMSYVGDDVKSVDPEFWNRD